MEKLIDAINGKKKVCFLYEGSTRVVDPYFFGMYKDKKVIIGHQTGGFKLFRKKGLYKFYINKMEFIEVLDISFIPKPKFLVQEPEMFDSLI